MGCGMLRGEVLPPERDAPGAPESSSPFRGVMRSSTMVFHAPHDGQRPSHLGESAPHSVQNHMVFSFDFAIGVYRVVGNMDEVPVENRMKFREDY